MQKVKLGDICTKQSSAYAQKDLNDLEGEYPIYGASGFIKKINIYHQDKDYVAVVKDGAGIGRTMYLPAKSSVIGTLQYLIPKEGIEPKYLYYAVKSSHLEKYYTGATIPHIYFKDYQNEPIILYGKDEQIHVVSILEKVEKIIEIRKQELKQLEELIKSRFVEMFGHPDTNEKHWKMNTFRDICTVRQGLQIPIAKRLKEYEEDCYEYITVQYLHGGKEREYIKSPKPTVICTKSDILMARTGNTGMVVTGVDGVFHNNFFLIDFDRDKYDRNFLVQYLNLDIIQADILRRAGTSTIPDLNHGEFYKIKVFEPPIELQRQFNNFGKQLDKSKLIIQKSLDELETLNEALMQKYFGGSGV